jgi:hypothetical protein
MEAMALQKHDGLEEVTQPPLLLVDGPHPHDCGDSLIKQLEKIGRRASASFFK